MQTVVINRLQMASDLKQCYQWLFPIAEACQSGCFISCTARLGHVSFSENEHETIVVVFRDIVALHNSFQLQDW